MNKHIFLLSVIICMLATVLTISARYYNPDIGRFTSADNVTQGDGADLQGLNRYSYCLNNPIIYVDPTGHNSEGAEQDRTFVDNSYIYNQTLHLPYKEAYLGSGNFGYSPYLDSLRYSLFENKLKQVEFEKFKADFESKTFKYASVLSMFIVPEMMGLGVTTKASNIYRTGNTFYRINMMNPKINYGIFDPTTLPNGDLIESLIDKNIGGIKFSGSIHFEKSSGIFTLQTGALETSDKHSYLFKNFLKQLESNALDDFGAKKVNIDINMIWVNKRENLLKERIWNRFGYTVKDKGRDYIKLEKNLVK